MIPAGPWMPSHFVMEAKAKVLLLFPHYEQDDVTYFGYHKLGISPAETDDVK
jgi:xylose isomerase